MADERRSQSWFSVCVANHPLKDRKTMLSRRFTVICLTIALIGMYMAALAANVERAVPAAGQARSVHLR